MSSYGFVIPSYQHSETLKPVLEELKKFELECIIVNDGSDEEHTERLRGFAAQNSWVSLVEHKKNQGKGAAVQTGLHHAQYLNWDYAIQVDSDGQHDLGSIDKLIEASRQNPGKLVSGKPVYDESIPTSRKIGRYITHFWVWIETLSFKIEDTMCGFRVYPVQKICKLLNESHLGQRMDFDIEIFVKSFWRGIEPHFVPVKVTYPEDGTSHFRAFEDNYLISKMHTLLVIGMIIRLPLLLFRKVFPVSKASSHWSNKTEKGMIFGMKIMIFIYKVFGVWAIRTALYPVAIYYFLFSRSVRKVSASYIKLYQFYCAENKLTAKPISSFRQIHAFADSMVDKFLVWQGEYSRDNVMEPGKSDFMEFSRDPKGVLFIGGHVGNMQIARAFGRENPNVKFSALVYTDHAKKFNSVLNSVNKDASTNLISVKSFSPALGIELKSKVDNNEWLFIAADRTSASQNNTNLEVAVLGQKAYVPKGPFVLAYILNTHIHSFFCLKQSHKDFQIQTQAMVPAVARSAKSKELYIQQLADIYAAELEKAILKAPEQWFNFFNFWSKE